MKITSWYYTRDFTVRISFLSLVGHTRQINIWYGFIEMNHPTSTTIVENQNLPSRFIDTKKEKRMYVHDNIAFHTNIKPFLPKNYSPFLQKYKTCEIKVSITTTGNTKHPQFIIKLKF